MSDFRRHLAHSLEDEEFRAEWEALEPWRETANALVKARKEAGFTQAELARSCGMKASSLCRIETGNSNPSVMTLARLAKAMGRHLKIEFV